MKNRTSFIEYSFQAKGSEFVVWQRKVKVWLLKTKVQQRLNEVNSKQRLSTCVIYDGMPSYNTLAGTFFAKL